VGLQLCENGFADGVDSRGNVAKRLPPEGYLFGNQYGGTLAIGKTPVS
jgi:hypothetical protein